MKDEGGRMKKNALHIFNMAICQASSKLKRIIYTISYSSFILHPSALHS